MDPSTTVLSLIAPYLPPWALAPLAGLLVFLIMRRRERRALGAQAAESSAENQRLRDRMAELTDQILELEARPEPEAGPSITEIVERVGEKLIPPAALRGAEQAHHVLLCGVIPEDVRALLDVRRAAREEIDQAVSQLRAVHRLQSAHLDAIEVALDADDEGVRSYERPYKGPTDSPDHPTGDPGSAPHSTD